VVADWVTISSLATAGGTLVLALATFASVRSANRSARVAEESLLASVRPLLMPSRLDDPMVKVLGSAENFWQGAIREPDDPDRDVVERHVAAGERTIVDVLYGDQHGGQRVISRFSLIPRDEGTFLVSSARQWNVDRPDPR
jgi:hypothetical protein